MVITISKRKDKITIEILGGNADAVTGSCSQISFGSRKILFECGTIQEGHTILENYRLNSKMVSKIKAKQIDTVIIGHVHCDHIGNIPTLFARGCRADILVPYGSLPILKEMWLDSAFINERDCEQLSKHDKCYTPLYTQSEVFEAISNVIEVEIGSLVKIDDELSLQYQHAGHILCSCQAEVFIKQGSHTKKIVFTSDLGNVQTQKERVFIEPFKAIHKANIVIGECTYSARERHTETNLEKDIEKIKAVVTQYCIDSNNRVLIPCFSLDRTPFLLWLLYDLFGKDENFKVPIIVDSPLSNRLLNCYSSILEGDKKEMFEELMTWKNIQRVTKPEESKAVMASSGAKIILSSSGMLTAGRSIKWTQSILPRSSDCILFVGYAGEGTLAHKIKNANSQKTINIAGKPVKNKCQIVNLKNFSSHMQREDLIKYYKSFNCQKIYLCHGDKEDKLEFKTDLENALADCLKSTRVVAVNSGTKISI